MKRILLTSTALVAFAGAAAAEGHTSISHALSATLGYNDTVNAFDDNEFGFYWEGNLKTTATATLDNGLTAGAYFEFTVGEDNGSANDDGGIAISSSDFVVSLTSETAGLYFGDTGLAADKHWKSAGDMEADGFATGHDSAALRGDFSMSGVNASISYLYDDANASVEAGQLGLDGSFGAISFALAYQEASTYVDTSGDYNGDEITAVSVTGAFAGADITVAYADNATADKTSTGIKVAYPFGPVTATAYYVSEDTGAGAVDDNYGVNVAYASGPIGVTLDYQNDQGTTKTALDGSYDVGSGVKVLAGYYNQDSAGYEDEYYVGATYDLGGGASILASYAVGATNADDEIGAPDYQEGLTIEASFSF
jgi:hypothetical protein